MHSIIHNLNLDLAWKCERGSVNNGKRKGTENQGSIFLFFPQSVPSMFSALLGASVKDSLKTP